VIDGVFLRTVDAATGFALGRYGARTPTIALRESNTELLQDGLLATALGALTTTGQDDRDVMVGLALHYVSAQRLGVVPAELFSAVAERLADPRIAGLLRTFGSRDDVTLEAFGWKLVTTLTGPDYEHT